MTLNATYIHKNFASAQVAFTPVTQAEVTLDLTDCKEDGLEKILKKELR